ncbi:hypothetical protein [Streptomyces sp. NPDC049555]|uniref:hypothetical protein n=1 Tax=unclassified Streptomyces TaxID=2593676 RepID=UPI00343C4431
MDAVRFALCGAVTAALTVCAGPAHAHDGPALRSGTLQLAPVSGRPGGEVRLRVSGCAGERGTASSEAFVTDARLAKGTTGLFAEATIRRAVRPGTYPVKVTCAGTDATADGRLTVVDAHRGTAPHDGPDDDFEAAGRAGHDAYGGHEEDDDGFGDAAGRDRAHPHASPVAPVPAGGGGSVPAPERPDTAGLVLAGTTAAIAGGLIWYRRRTDAAGR